MRTCSTLGLAACVLALPLSTRAADWPQWRGPDRSGVSKETGLLTSWPKGGPPLVWTFKKAGTGYGGPAVVGGKLYCTGADGDTEHVFAVENGEELWRAKIGPLFDFKGNSWSKGPNATPTVDGDLVYALGSQGDLVCVEKAKGTVKWRKSMPKDLGGEVNPVGGGPEKMGWGYAWSPLVEGDLLICIPGGPQGLLAALDKKTGDVRWRSKDATGQATYSSPIAATIGDVRQVIQMTQDGAVGVAVKDGSVLWTYKRDQPYPDVVCPTPIVEGDRVYLTAWGGGATLLQIKADGKKFTAERLNAKKQIGNRHGGVVLVGKSVYGYNEERAWICQDFANLAVKWQSPRGTRGLEAGSLIAAEGKLYCLTDKGEVALLPASPAKFAVTSRFTLPQKSTERKERGAVWTPPVIADRHLYLRDQEYIFCYKIAK